MPNFPEKPQAITIRPARETDLDAIAGIESRCFTAPWSGEQYRHEFALPFSRLRVAVTADQIIGFLLWWVITDEAELHKIAVTPEWAGRGVGRLLLDALFSEVAREGAVRIDLEVRAGNAAAIHLYASTGFELVGRRSDYYERPCEDALLYSRKLREG